MKIWLKILNQSYNKDASNAHIETLYDQGKIGESSDDDLDLVNTFFWDGH